MRTNLPVTGIEYILEDGPSIVSKTDTRGRITYVNPTFIEVSGFAHEELIGKAHNIVRHPDMPPDAFADLWRRTESQAAGQNTESAVRADGLAGAASNVADRGGAAVQQVGTTMSRISGSATRIVDIIGLIDGIAFQKRPAPENRAGALPWWPARCVRWRNELVGAAGQTMPATPRH